MKQANLYIIPCCCILLAKIMINLSELSGVTFRNALNASRVRKSYENKHKDGSGNFGFVIIFEKAGVKDVGCGMTAPNETWFALHGHYTPQKQVYGLNFGDYSRPISRIPDDWTFKQLKDYMWTFIDKQENPNGNKVQFT